MRKAWPTPCTVKGIRNSERFSNLLKAAQLSSRRIRMETLQFNMQNRCSRLSALNSELLRGRSRCYLVLRNGPSGWVSSVGKEYACMCSPSWLIHVNVWQKPLQCYKVISLQLIKINEKRICLQCKRLSFYSWVRKVIWRRKWQPTPGFLPGESHGQRSLEGYSPWGCRSRIRPSN